MKKITLAFLLLVLSHLAIGQDTPITTFILVRHAEKDLTQSTSDPDLSADGKARATRLVEMLQQTDIHGVYSTNFKRTQQTVEQVALAKSLAVTVYDARNTADIDAMITKHAGQTILVSGHSNTIPAFANYLIGEDKYQPMGDGEYGNIIVVSLTARGKSAKIVWLEY